ncbi:hypothetical protein GIB67_024944 [Kingdonia uniflora]|uniref:FAD-binding FR-type domain-containing protein n=1 Tax=Kingdonia uniflora TaxID=39325 RepID=A0A7J7NZB4_9MAGN|nr:hypothetical protein GIB67_024944 [Kingdonia uniflora]
MSITLHLPSSLSSPRHAPSSMSILRRLNLHHTQTPKRRRFASLAVTSASLRQDTTTLWTQAPLSEITSAAESLFHVSIDVSDSPDLFASYTRPGQYLQLRLRDVERPSFLAIASPPSVSVSRGVFEFLVKSVVGSTAEMVCRLKRGDVVELSSVMGKGFDVEKISPAEEFQTVLIFATGSGISFIEWLASAPSEKVHISPTTVEIYAKIVEKTRVFQFLVGLNPDFEYARVHLLDKTPFPTLEEAHAYCLSDQSRRSLTPPISRIPSETSAMAIRYAYPTLPSVPSQTSHTLSPSLSPLPMASDLFPIILGNVLGRWGLLFYKGVWGEKDNGVWGGDSRGDYFCRDVDGIGCPGPYLPSCRLYYSSPPFEDKSACSPDAFV